MFEQRKEFEGKIWKVCFDGTLMAVCEKTSIATNYYLINTEDLTTLGTLINPQFDGMSELSRLKDSILFFYLYPDMTDPSDFKIIQLDMEQNVTELTELPLEDINAKIPERYLETDQYFADVAGFLENKIGRSPVRALDYMEIENSILISYYLYEGQLLSLNFSIFNKKGNLVFDTVLERNLQAIGTESFTFNGDGVYFVRDGSVLCKLKAS